MTQISRKTLISSLLLACSGYCQAEPTTVEMGDGQVDGTRIQPYALIWQQCMKQDGEWSALPALTETVTIEGDDLIVAHDSARPGGGSTRSRITLERSSLSPQSTHTEVLAADGTVVASIANTLTETGYDTLMRQGEAENTKTGSLNSRQFNGSVLGLPLATLDYEKAPYSVSASMMAFDASYTLLVTHAGQETVSFNDVDVTVDWVDVEWKHEGIGDIYPPGPDASGGRYWIAHKPPEGFPYVLRYKTDSYAVEFLNSVCPSGGQTEEESDSGK